MLPWNIAGKPTVLVATSIPCSDTLVFVHALERLCRNSVGSVNISIHINCYSGMNEHEPHHEPMPSSSCTRVSTSAVKGMKGLFWKLVLTPLRTAAFDFIWLMDADMQADSPKFSLSRAIEEMQAANASLAQPRVSAATSGGRSSDFPLLRAGNWSNSLALRLCRAASTSHVDVQTPLFRRDAWLIVHRELFSVAPNELLNRTDYGIARTWCGLLQNYYKIACAVLRSVIRHRDSHLIELAHNVSINRYREDRRRHMGSEKLPASSVGFYEAVFPKAYIKSNSHIPRAYGQCLSRITACSELTGEAEHALEPMAQFSDCTHEPVSPQQPSTIPLGRPWNATFVHIAKTGGLAIEEWLIHDKTGVLGELHQVLVAGGRSDQDRHILKQLNLSSWRHYRPRCKTRSGRESLTAAHCVGTYEAAQWPGGRAHEAVSFCVVRDPVDRALSTFNMREEKYRGTDKCGSHLSTWVRGYLSHGDMDNHDTHQTSFMPYCAIRLCFDRIRDEFRRLATAWWIDNFGEAPSAAVVQAFDLSHRTWVHDPARSCNASQLDHTMKEQLLQKYQGDVAEHRRTCFGTSPH